MTPITLRIPVDVVDAMKEIAPQRGFAGYFSCFCGVLLSITSWQSPRMVALS